MNKGGKAKTPHLYLINLQDIVELFAILLKNQHGFSCLVPNNNNNYYVTMTVLKPSPVNVQLAVNKIIACLNGIWKIMENYL